MADFKADSILIDYMKFNELTPQERDQLPTDGSLMVFNSSTNRIEVYTGGAWEQMPISSEVSSPASPFSAPTGPNGSPIYPQAVGGITNDQAGLNLLDGQNFQQIIENIFFPAQLPTHGAPSVALTINHSLVIAGTNISVSMNASYNPRTISTSWSPYLDDQGNAAPTTYGKAATNYEFLINDVSQSSGISSSYTTSYTVQPNSNKFAVSLTYGGTNALYNSYGVEVQADDPTPVTISSTEYIDGTYPIYTNSNSVPGALSVALPLVKLVPNTSLFEIDLQEAGSNKHSFAVPTAMGTVTDIQFKDLTGEYQSIFGDWSGTATPNFAHGVEYNVWTHTGVNAGAREFKVIIS